MNVHVFNSVPKHLRAALVWQHGWYLAMRIETGFSIVLYNMRHFFAEVSYHSEDNEIAKVHGFKSSKVLEPYLDSINIKELMK